MKTVQTEEILVSISPETEALLEKIGKEKRKKKIGLSVLIACLCFSFFSFGLFFGYLIKVARTDAQKEKNEAEEKVVDYGVPDWVIPAIIDLDGESRTGIPLGEVKDIAVHYVANPGSTADANRNYFNNPDSTTSSHFIVGLKGEVLLCVPLDEKSSATNHRNIDTISIEVCHPDETGEFSFETRDSLIRLLVFLCEKYDLSTDHIIRHYDVTGKMCPLYYVENPEAWDELKQNVADEMRKGK